MYTTSTLLEVYLALAHDGGGGETLPVEGETRDVEEFLMGLFNTIEFILFVYQYSSIRSVPGP